MTGKRVALVFQAVKTVEHMKQAPQMVSDYKPAPVEGKPVAEHCMNPRIRMMAPQLELRMYLMRQALRKFLEQLVRQVRVAVHCMKVRQQRQVLIQVYLDIVNPLQICYYPWVSIWVNLLGMGFLYLLVHIAHAQPSRTVWRVRLV